MRNGIVIHTILASVVLAGRFGDRRRCGAAGPFLSPTTAAEKMVAELLFGRDVGHHAAVSQSAWLGFVVRGMISRFPDGLTITDAIGVWRERNDGAIVRESSKRVEIVLPGNEDDQTRLGAIVTAYKHQFRQRSVGVIVRPACVAF
jgi:Protein of unknown function (DUF3574)